MDAWPRRSIPRQAGQARPPRERPTGAIGGPLQIIVQQSAATPSRVETERAWCSIRISRRGIVLRPKSRSSICAAGCFGAPCGPRTVLRCISWVRSSAGSSVRRRYPADPPRAATTGHEEFRPACPSGRAWRGCIPLRDHGSSRQRQRSCRALAAIIPTRHFARCDRNASPFYFLIRRWAARLWRRDSARLQAAAARLRILASGGLPARRRR